MFNTKRYIVIYLYIYKYIFERAFRAVVAILRVCKASPCGTFCTVTCINRQPTIFTHRFGRTISRKVEPTRNQGSQLAPAEERHHQAARQNAPHCTGSTGFYLRRLLKNEKSRKLTYRLYECM